MIILVLFTLILLQNLVFLYFKGYFAKGNSSKYSVKNTEMNQKSKLKGKTIIFLGSSVTEGAGAKGESFVDYLEKVDGIVPIKEAVSGTTMDDNGNGYYIERMITNIDTEVQADAFICQLSTNDATKELPLGEISESTNLEKYDTGTVTGAMEYIICYVKKTWNCPVAFYTNSRYNSETYDVMVKRLYELQNKWNIGVIDMWSDERFNAIDEKTRALYIEKKGIHPYRAGYREWWLPKFEEYLTDIFK